MIDISLCVPFQGISTHYFWHLLQILSVCKIADNRTLYVYRTQSMFHGLYNTIRNIRIYKIYIHLKEYANLWNILSIDVEIFKVERIGKSGIKYYFLSKYLYNRNKL